MRKDVRRSRRRGPALQWLLLMAGLAALLALAPVLAHAQSPDSVALVWTAPGDDGTVGTATLYQLRVSLQPIDDTNWDQASSVPGLPAPLPAGTRQNVVVSSLTRGTTYWFAIKTQDDNGNWSGLSNLIRWDWVYDTAPPAAPSGLTAAREATLDVRVHWSANAEADLAGYTVYRALTDGGPFVPLTGAPIVTTEYVDTTLPTGTTDAWYQVTATDVSGNESARSSAVAVSLDESAAQAGDWRIEPGYPNPSRLGSMVRIPMMVPSGAGEALVEINDSGGRRIWRRDLGVPASGPFTLNWDGRNEAGRDVAPGVYTAWLITGKTRFSVKLVRVP
ncbi:MAG TPA: FlgD immunoglobulin-like domain containing protein [Candidatus Limnocylindria bacterium]|nr:FlgD immunoglobulin-like domain containing protein [Candidatus Limnocylindria bacterium]